MEEVCVPSKGQVNISNKKEPGKPNTIREKYQACSSLPQELETCGLPEGEFERLTLQKLREMEENLCWQQDTLKKKSKWI